MRSGAVFFLCSGQMPRGQFGTTSDGHMLLILDVHTQTSTNGVVLALCTTLKARTVVGCTV